MSDGGQSPGMDTIRFGLAIRALRRRKRWSQAELAKEAQLSQSAVSRAERGDAWRLTVRTLNRIAEALGARASIRLLWQGEALDRLLDAAHAGLVDQVIAVLVEHGWEVVPEATFNRYGERGSIDVLAWHPEHGALLIIEVKSVVPDIQALLAGVDRKRRISPHLARDRGWRVSSVSRLIVLPDDRTARRRVAAHAATFDRAYPARTREIRRWLAEPSGELAGVLFLPSSPRTTARHRVRGGSGPKTPEQALNRPAAGRSADR
jgi:transcriptional regulator with XRE-family HTH domain